MAPYWENSNSLGLVSKCTATSSSLGIGRMRASERHLDLKLLVVACSMLYEGLELVECMVHEHPRHLNFDQSIISFESSFRIGS